uniref:Coiled-coil domain containing 114 n=1 Tax=Nothobranchius furzeri TaxID=105023 RepID=A0A1A8UR34_NOTFU
MFKYFHVVVFFSIIFHLHGFKNSCHMHFKFCRAESEITKLQRQLRIMERDRQTYNFQAREQIRKQQQEIEKLMKEQEELHRNLGACKNLSRQQRDDKDSQGLQVLLEQRDVIEEELERERHTQKQLQKEILSVQVKLAEVRKGAVSSSDTQRSEAGRTLKAIRTLEYKLDRASTRFNEQMAKNNRLKEELQTLHIERARFQHLRNRLNKELQDVRKSIGQIINRSTAAYDGRVEAQAKMNTMKAKAEKDRAHYNAEMKELERIFSHEFSTKDFMSIKSRKIAEKDDDHGATPRQLSALKEQKVDSGEESLVALEEALEKIQTVMGDDNLDLLVNRFIQAEDRNFALFNFVNDQNNEAETLRKQISQIQKQMEQLQLESLQREEQHRSLLRGIDEQRKECESQAENLENQANAVSRILDEIKEGVNSLLSKMECDRSVIEDKLGSSVGITENNVMFYLGLVEQKTNELLTVHTFLKSKDQEKDQSPADLAKFLLGQTPELFQQNLTIQPNLKSHPDKFSLTDEEERPFSQEELRRTIMKGVLGTGSYRKLKAQSAAL